jgi:hypothetical protein
MKLKLLSQKQGLSDIQGKSYTHKEDSFLSFRRSQVLPTAEQSLVASHTLSVAGAHDLVEYRSFPTLGRELLPSARGRLCLHRVLDLDGLSRIHTYKSR